AQDGKGHLERAGEAALGVEVVRADAHHRGARDLELDVVLAELAGLDRAAWREGLGEEIDDDAQGVLLVQDEPAPLAPHSVDRRRRVSDLEHPASSPDRFFYHSERPAGGPHPAGIGVKRPPRSRTATVREPYAYAGVTSLRAGRRRSRGRGARSPWPRAP